MISMIWKSQKPKRMVREGAVNCVDGVRLGTRGVVILAFGKMEVVGNLDQSCLKSEWSEFRRE